ncbi:MAG: serine hydrolase domain-containing protein [Gammaproteobacteria bacterium]
MTDADPRLSDSLDHLTRRLGVPGAGAGIIAAGRAPILDVAGRRRRDRPDPVQAGDRWHIGSCCKAVTALLYARLVEQGRAEWDLPVAALFPDLAATVHAGWAERSVSEVFHCRAGVPADLTGAGMRAAWQDRAPLAQQRSAIAARTLARPPGPRGRFLYSNLGYILIGAAIDRIVATGGADYESALATDVLHPLGITSHGFGPPPENLGHHCRFRVASLILGRGAPADPAIAESDNPPVMNPAGRLHLSLADWIRLQTVFLDQPTQFLSRTTMDRLLAPPTGRGPPMAMGWVHARIGGRPVLAMQGSNTLWAATAVMDAARSCMAVIIANDGRSRVLSADARLASRLIAEAIGG